MNGLTVVVPSRGRPDNIRRLNQAFDDTCTRDTTLTVCVDDDDPTLDDYYNVWLDEGHGFELVVGSRLFLGPTLNKVALEEARTSSAVGFMGDDHLPRTHGWDEEYLNVLSDLGTGLVYGNDLYQGKKLPTQVAMTSDIVLKTGHFVPEGMTHLYLDDAWKTLGEALGALAYLPDVIIEHMHPVAGKAEYDEGYFTCNSPEMYNKDAAAYAIWKRDVLPEWVRLING